MPPNLLSLPVELRQLIYEELFSTYTIRHGFNPNTATQNRAAILQTCKQIYHEALPFLPQNISFHFRGTETMLETLMTLSPSTLHRIRHVRVKSFPFPLYPTASSRDFYSTFYFSWALTLLPGLNLDRLVVDDSFHGRSLVDPWRDIVTYFDIEELLKSDGWRELRYVSPNTDFIASGYDHKRRRRAQPEGWDGILKERDGVGSGAEVRMFITPEGNSGEEEGSMIPWKAKPGHEVILDNVDVGPEQDMKGTVTIVARRGKKANCTQSWAPDEGIKLKSWKDLKGNAGDFKRQDWTPYYNDMADAVSWIYGGWGRRMQLANMALTT